MEQDEREKVNSDQESQSTTFGDASPVGNAITFSMIATSAGLRNLFLRTTQKKTSSKQGRARGRGGEGNAHFHRQ